ncbi:unnamed protein product [Fraxinus pennsylvanica]|uniref:RING-type E3 ubiquitin transferase n=1 Tax=Fraxinus pennsylvanica TaxID=56036 RepID=A0AAD1ZHM9_9LAMI|nr:unnamed protein product [Fraxinus pennsylvanica]
MGEIEELEPRIRSPPIEEDALYVALGKDVKESVTVLKWALNNSGGRKIYILHIHQPAQKIPMDAMATNVPIRLLDEHKVRAYHENQRREMQEILEQYVQICHRAGNQAETLPKEMDSIEKGIVQLLSQRRIKWIVMGTGSCKTYSRGKETTLKKIFFFRNSTREMIIPKSRKATYVRLKAPSFCRISFIWKGKLIHTRESDIHGIYIDLNSASPEASTNAETTESSLRSLSVTEGENDRLSLSGSFPNYLRVRSADLGMRRLNSGGREINSASPEASTNAETTESSLRSLSVTEGENDRLSLSGSFPNYLRVRSADLGMRRLNSGGREINSASPEASSNAETTESSLRSLSVTEEGNDRLSLSGSFPNYRRVRSADLGMRRLNSEGSTDLDSSSRESEVDGIYIERDCESPQASTNAETTEASLSSLSVTEGENDGLNIPDPVPNCHTFGSDDLVMRFLSPPDDPGTVTPQSRLNPEGSTYRDSPSRRSPSVSSLFSTCPSREIIQDTASGSLECTEGNERLESPMPEDNEWGGCHQLSIAVSSLEGTMSDDIYHRLGQSVARVESFCRDVHKESVRRKKAENNVIDAIHRVKESATMYTELLRHRREIEQSLARSKKDVEEMKSKLVAVINARRSQNANSSKKLEELEQKLFSAVELSQLL